MRWIILTFLLAKINLYGNENIELKHDNWINIAQELNDSEGYCVANFESLFECFDKKNLHYIQFLPVLIENGFDPNETINDETILHRAIFSGNLYEGTRFWNDYIECINTLVFSGIDINQKYNGKSAIELLFDIYLIGTWDPNYRKINELHLAQLVEPFLLAGFDPQSAYKITNAGRGKISFFEVIKSLNFYAVLDAIEGDNRYIGYDFAQLNMSAIRKALKNGRNFRNFRLQQLSPLRRGSEILPRKGMESAMMILLENGFEPISVASDHTPLHDAVLLNSKEAIEILLKNGADINLETRNTSFTELSHKGETPLMLAASHKSAESFACLVYHGAKLDITLETQGFYNCSLSVYIKHNNHEFQEFRHQLRSVRYGLHLNL